MKSLVIIICLFSLCILLNYGNSITVEELVTKSVEEVKPRHCVLWTNLFDGAANKSQHLKNYQRFLKNLLSKIPTLQKSMNKSTRFVPGKYVYDVNISAPMHYFFIVEENKNQHDSKLKSILNRIPQSIMYLSTPKLLMVFYQRNESSSSITSTLDTARDLQFFDCVVLQVVKNQAPVIYRNKFSLRKFDKTKNIKQKSKLFLDYLKNLKGYNIRVGVTKNWHTSKKNLDEYPAHLAPNSRLNNFYEYFSEFLNITTTFIVTEYVKDRSFSIKEHNLEMALEGSDIVIGIWRFENIYILRYSKVVALVPLIHEAEIKASNDILYSFLGLSSLIVGLFLFFKYSRYSAAGWSCLNIFQLMLGNSANVQLRNLPAKLAYGLLLAISIFFISDLLSDLTTINYEYKQEPLAGNVDEIMQKKLSICTPNSFTAMRYLSKYCTEKDRKILNINKVCKRNLEKNEVMIAYEFNSEKRLYHNLLNDINNLTEVDMNLPTFIYGVNFRPNSALKNKFGQVESRYKEFGLEAKWASDLKVRRPKEKERGIDTDDEGLVRSLILLLLIGWGVSITVFLLELLWYHVIKNLNVIVLEEPIYKKPRNVTRIQVESRV